MNIIKISYKNLLRKKTRSALTIVGIGLSAWVLASLMGFNQGYESSLNRDIDNMGFQVILTAKGCPYEAATLMLKGGTGLRYMNESVAQEVVNNPEVEKVTPMLMQAVFDPNKGESGGISAYLGVDPVTFPQMKSFFEFKQGGWFTDPDALEVVMGYEAAELEQREVGRQDSDPREERRAEGRRDPEAHRNPGRRDDLHAHPVRAEDLRSRRGPDRSRDQGQEGGGHRGLRGAALQTARCPGGLHGPGEADHHEPRLHRQGDGLLHRRHRDPDRHGRA